MEPLGLVEFLENLGMPLPLVETFAAHKVLLCKGASPADIQRGGPPKLTQPRNHTSWKESNRVSTSTSLKILIHNYLVWFGHFSHSPSTVLHRVLKNDFSRLFWFFQSNQIASLTPNHQDETCKMIEEQPETWHWDLAKWIFGDELHANLAPGSQISLAYISILCSKFVSLCRYSHIHNITRSYRTHQTSDNNGCTVYLPKNLKRHQIHIFYNQRKLNLPAWGIKRGSSGSRKGTSE